MSRIDDLQAAWELGKRYDTAVCFDAIPDLLAVVRAAQEALEPLGLDAQPRTELVLVRAGLHAALKEFEEGGKP